MQAALRTEGEAVPKYVTFCIWLGLIVNILSLIIYTLVIFQLRRLSANRYVIRFAQRQRQFRVAAMFVWVSVSDLLLDVIPYVAVFASILGQSNFKTQALLQLLIK